MNEHLGCFLNLMEPVMPQLPTESETSYSSGMDPRDAEPRSVHLLLVTAPRRPRWHPLAQLPAASFAAVMATGIVSVAADDASQLGVATLLRWLAVAMLGLLVGLHVTRAALHPHAAGGEVGHPSTVFDAFSIAAGLAVVGASVGTQVSAASLVAIWLGVVALWLGALLLAVRALCRHRRSGLVRFVSGRWLLAVVTTESIAVLGAVAAAAAHSRAIAVAALLSWVAGLALYPAVLLAIVTRLQRRGWHAVDLTPDHWIVMGALAISTLSAAGLLAGPKTGLIRTVHGSILIGAWVTWIGASALCPVLAVATLCRWLGSRTARRQDIRWWAVVFPLGMYSACTFALVSVARSDALQVLALATYWVALAAWLLVGLMSLFAVARTVGRWRE
jgi:tellurite resistance protein TehA-like permease